MRSDLILNANNINKMIQFGTVKYGIVKQLKERSKNEREDIINDQEENGSSSLSCSPVIECIQLNSSSQETMVNTDDDLVHNNNILETAAPTNTSTEISLTKSSSYSNLMLDDKNIKTPSPALAEQQNHIADQPQASPAIEGNLSTSETNIITNHDDKLILENKCVIEDNSTEKKSENSLEKSNESSIEVSVEESSSSQTLTTTTEEVSKTQNSEKPAKELSSDKQENENVDCSNAPPQMPQFPAGPVTLEVIQNMQLAIAQFAAKTFANGNNEANEAAMKQLAFLQQTLFNLQQQQLFQIQLIQQLQSQLAMNHMKDGVNTEDDEDSQQEDGKSKIENQKSVDNLNDTNRPISKKRSNSCFKSDDEDDDEDLGKTSTTRRKSSDSEAKLVEDEKDCLIEFKKFRPDEPLEYGEIREGKDGRYLTSKGVLLPPYLRQDENTPLPYGSDLASSIITNHGELPSADQPNSLEMLQKRAQEVLDSASQGILSGNLADELAFGKNKDDKNRNEPFFKHRCRYCGKVFGSDSALQIHIRSHTGERPFKCNVCGSRFTTKGNLKVHFQRHAQKFPHIPMNATPIPEHLDKFHPPLLDQMSSPESTPPHQPQMPPVPATLPLQFPGSSAFQGLQSLYRPPLDLLKSLGSYSNPFLSSIPQLTPPSSQQSQSSPHQLKEKKDEEMPTDLRKPLTPDASVVSKISNAACSNTANVSEKPSDNDKSLEAEEKIKIKEEKMDDDEDNEVRPEKQSKTPTEKAMESKSIENLSQHQIPSIHSHPMITASSMIPMHPHSHDYYQSVNNLPPSFGREDMMDPRGLHLGYRTPPDRRSPASIPRHSPFLGPTRHPHEMALLPRPHSNDNSWENFIEISNTSETLKLKELMKNKKLTDPNQCLVCDRVLSCKSALQMHYRTHTGERPFKCRICGRAFTTKGNLKTHMAVHKIRPPMRNFHQCPVCHKKYSNALVLQQHIRLHTGEPTDLTPEQISAAEIRDFPPSMMHGSFMNPFAFNFGIGPHNGHHMGSESSLGEMDDNMDCSDDFDDDLSEDHISNGGDSDHRPKSRDDIRGMLFEQKLKIDNNPPLSRPKSETSASSAPGSPISALNKSSPDPSDLSQGALDLTPKNLSSMSTTHVQQLSQLHSKPPTPKQASPPPILQPVVQQPVLLSHPPPPLPPLPQMPPQMNNNHPLSQMMPQRPPFGMFPNIPLFPPTVSLSSTQNMCNAMNSIAQSVMPSAPYNPLALSGVRGSTTCGICFKTFPCHSALEIHYRSHTKERPFKCSICDRGFTTKGNLKQHMLTHKIRDMEQDAFRNRAVKFEYMRNAKDGFE